MPASLSDRLSVAPMYALPHHLLSALMRASTRVRLRVWKDWQMRWFIRRYSVDMSIAQQPDPHSYAHFNDFFTRSLRPDARPVCQEPDHIACPADGAISEFGDIDGDSVFQAKGQTYSLNRLLGGDTERRPCCGFHRRLFRPRLEALRCVVFGHARPGEIP